MYKLILLASLAYLAMCATMANTAIQAQRSVPTCMSGYFWNQQTCQPCQSIANGQCLCTNSPTCTSGSCQSGYTYQNGVCVAQLQCPSNSGCITCGMGADAMYCYTCSSAYTLIGNVCIKNLGCSNYDTSSAICLNCQSGFYLSYNYTFAGNVAIDFAQYYATIPRQCQPCAVANCAKCNSGSTCTQCNTGFYWQVGLSNNQGSCTSCASNCMTCTGQQPQNCQTCNPNYFQNPQTFVCATCMSTITGCAVCASASTCQTCQVGFTLSQDQTQCTKVVTPVCQVNGCQTSTCNGNTCQVCMNLYAPAPVNGQCLPCPQGCATCIQYGTQQVTTCTACMDTYYMVQNSATSSCALCSTVNPAYLRCNGKNDSSPSPSATPIPTQCVDGYFLFNNTCVAAQPINTCLTIASMNSANCQSCLPDYHQYTIGTCQGCLSNCQTCGASPTAVNTVVCTTCNEGYYGSGSTQCSQCPNGCSACQNQTYCSNCLTGYYPNNFVCNPCSTSFCQSCSNNTCTTCMNGYFMFNSGNSIICNPCPTNCATCNPPGSLCSSCNPGYYLNSNGCVSLSSANCLTSDPVQGCTACRYGFFLKNGFCFQCVNPYTATVCRGNTADPTTNVSNSTGASPSSSTNSSSNAFIATFLISLVILLAH